MDAFDDLDLSDDGLARAIALAVIGQPATDATPESPDLPKRSRGGQPRNLNARKHGFYARALTEEE